MKDRLQQFLTMENLTPGRFAEIMGVQRGGISHLLSGRNNPSYDFIKRMMSAFPNLNYEWLILGKGKPYKDSSEVKISEPENTNLFNQLDFEEQSEEQEVELFPVSQPSMVEKPLAQVPENAKKEQPDVRAAVKSIKRITIWYSDGTYEDR